jgi:hypothetical protein
MSGGNFSSIPQAMLDMMAKMKLEEEAADKTPPENYTTADSPTQNTNLQQQTPTTAKRKFQKILATTQHLSQLSNANSHSPSNNSMVSLAAQANQDQ